jgi:hypothetical protein
METPNIVKIGGVSIPQKFVLNHKDKESWTKYAKKAQLFNGSKVQDDLIEQAWNAFNPAETEEVKPEMIDHIVTQEDLDNNADLVAQNVNVGDTIQIPKPAEEPQTEKPAKKKK